MKSFGVNGYAVHVGLAAALLAGCGGHSGSGAGAIPSVNGAGSGPRHHQRFSYTGHPQTFKVPDGVTSITISASGASGGGGTDNYGSTSGGNGGLVKATIAVTPGEKLAVFVGRVELAPAAGTAAAASTAGDPAVLGAVPAAVAAAAVAAPRTCGRAVMD